MGDVDYVVLRNRSSTCAVDLEGLVLETGFSFSVPFVIPAELPQRVLQPGEEVAVIEVGETDAGLIPPRPGDIAVPTIFLALDLGAVVKLCHETCAVGDAGPAGVVVDYFVAGNAVVEEPLTFDGTLGQLADVQSQSYHRVAVTGTYPNFTAADWEVGVASRPTAP